MDTVESLNHSVWDCKYHVVFIPKCRRKTLYGDLRQYLGEVFRRWPSRRRVGSRKTICLSDHLHMFDLPFRRSTRWRRWWGSSRESAIHLARVYGGAQEEPRGAALLGARVVRVHGLSR
jgi:putative transposase